MLVVESSLEEDQDWALKGAIEEFNDILELQWNVQSQQDLLI